MNNYFSIVIPLYNKEESINRTLLSVYNQNYKYYEIIIINDGSTDKSIEIVQRFTQKHNCKNITLFSQYNKGISHTRNKGIEISKYPFICFLDADDIWFSNYLEELNFLINKYPTIDMYFTEYLLFRDKTLVKSITINDNKTFVINYFKYMNMKIRNNNNHICFTGFRKESLIRINGFRNYNMDEDTDLFFRIKLNTPLVACSTKVCGIWNNSNQENRNTTKYKKCKEGHSAIPTMVKFYNGNNNDINKFLFTNLLSQLRRNVLFFSSKKSFYILKIIIQLFPKVIKTIDTKTYICFLKFCFSFLLKILTPHIFKIVKKLSKEFIL